MQEIWEVIDEFPNYRVSDQGRILNHDANRLLRLSTTRQGAVKVGLVKAGEQYTRSVKVLVAEAFVSGRSDICDTPIQLDGNPENLAADNLQWRPRWFAWKYTKQFEVLDDYRDRGRVVDVNTGEVYWDVVDVVVRNGLLLTEVWKCMRSGEPIFPTNQILAPAG